MLDLLGFLSMSALFLIACLCYHVYKTFTQGLFIQLICSEICILRVSTLILPRIKQILYRVRIHLSNVFITGILYH